ncbi:MAG: PQQ-binding-like beta-propeller repeat protein [Verrucomicrobia bacterium]|nr:PQQ-binding-like beta-propeller repeat protein [Verrucomicrobiota bacterium]
MIRFYRFTGSLALMLAACCAHAENWPQWRGPRLDGTSAEQSVPKYWSQSSNVVWKTPLPGVGHASPIVWDDRVFTVTALPAPEARVLLCLERGTGRMLWQRTVLVSPPEKKHNLNSHASSTPATDGRLVFTAFLDRREVLVSAHDFRGQPVWTCRPGVFSSMHGFCSSPILFEDKVIVNCDHDGDGYIVALARATGKELWRIERPNKTRSYCTPLIRPMAGRAQMVLSGSKCVASYAPHDGKLLWIIDGPTDQFVASPVFSDGTQLLYITGGFPDHHILAIRPDGAGNVTQTKIVWRTTKGVAYVPSPICAGKFFFVVSDSGVAHCFDAATGGIAWTERLGEHHASLVAAGGRVYFLNDNGVMNVVKPGRRFDLVARNEIGEKTFASPALSRGQIFLRGDKHLFCIGADR